MKCGHAKKIISRYVDGDLSPVEKKEFDSHLLSCVSCREALKETLALRRTFASARKFTAPYGFSTRVLANLEEAEGFAERRFGVIRPLFLRTAQVAVALAVMVLGLFSGNQLLEERTPPPVQTAVQQTFSLDLFQPTPPGSIGGIYVNLMRANHEE